MLMYFQLSKVSTECDHTLHQPPSLKVDSKCPSIDEIIHPLEGNLKRQQTITSGVTHQP